MTTEHADPKATEMKDRPEIRKIGLDDLGDALARGRADFMAKPSHVIFLALLYPVVGLLLMAAAFDYPLVPLLYPLFAGFALVGPVAGLGLYEISRRRGMGHETSYADAFGVFGSAQFGSIFALSVLLAGIFGLWIFTANVIYGQIMGPPPTDILDFFRGVFLTPEGWTLILVGNAVGAVFAVAAFTLSVTSFPMLLDRPVGLGTAIGASVRAVLENPLPMLAWGFVVALAIGIASVPFLLGLAFVLPILGHATWHLYKKVVV